MRKISLPLTGGMSILCLIAQSAFVLAETSQPALVSFEQVVTAETRSATSPTVPEAEIIVIPIMEPTPATSLLIAQTATEAIPQEQTAPTATVEDQVTSVSQLLDVQPTDWAFSALQSLIERYGVIAGYPDNTYRGNRAMTRYEFAAGLNAALDQVNQLIATGLADQVSRDDLVTLQRLQEDFATELATLRNRVDTLEAHTAELEANQFSTTTKITGQAIFAVNVGGFSGDRIVDPTGVEIANEDPNATILYRANLDFDTSFSGTDLLKIRVDTGSNGGGDNAGGFLEPTFGSVLDFSIKPPFGPQFNLSRLYYTFTAFNDLKVTLGSQIVVTDFVDLNSYANLSFLDFSTQALINNYILIPIFGPSAGAVINWNPGKGPFTMRAAYVAADAANPNSDNDQRFLGPITSLTSLLYAGSGGNRGVFGDPYQGTVELEYAADKAFAVRLQYSGGNILDGRFDVFGVNLELAISPQVGVFGRYGYGSYDDTNFGDIEPNYWMAGVAFRDLFEPGTLVGIAVGQPFIESAVGNATQTNIEAFYNLPVNDNIRLTPLVQVIIDPANQNSNGTIVTGTLRTVFSF